MKIVFDFKIFSHQKFGGPSRYFFNLFENLSSINKDTYVSNITYINYYLSKSNFKKNIFGIYLPKVKYLNYYLNKINKNFSYRNISKIKPDILHTTDYFNAPSDNIRPLIVTVHDLIHEIFHDEFGKTKDYRPKKDILRIADHIICVSENTKKDLINIYNIDSKKISVVYHGNSFETVDQSFDETSIKKNNNYFLYIGSRKRYKNFFTFVKAFKKNKEIYENYNIVCIGGGNLLDSEKKKLAEENINLKKIIIHQSYDDSALHSLYKNACALIYPSLYEGFGMPILEAMALNCPVICSDTSSMLEVSGDAALTFSPLSYEDLSDKMFKIISDSVLRKKLIIEGIQQSKKFTWKKCANETLSVYNKLT